VTPQIPKWTLTWHFDCHNVSGGKGSFSLVLHPLAKKGSAKDVASQHGLGGGGSNFYSPGRYSIAVTTSCAWSVTGLT
jgi:hypothetical protein